MIRVRRARPGESLRTLDGELRTLDASMLVIADAERAQAIAGVMGGADSEVSDRTTLVLLESAYFDPRSVRRTSRQLGLKTEASARFERGADPSMQAAAIERAAVLLARVAAGEALGPLIDCHPAPITPRQVLLRRARIGRILGFEVADTEVQRILRRLGFDLAAEDKGWLATVPVGRVDVTREIDLVEEVGRHAGFDRIPTTYPNPIDFENAEGNLGVANSLLAYYAQKLPVSRLQRDLSDSTVRRTFGTALGHSLVAWTNIRRGLTRIAPDEEKLRAELNAHWEVVAEGAQTILRAAGKPDAYESLKQQTRGRVLSEADYRSWCETIDVDEETRERLLSLSPDSYLALAIRLTEIACG